MYILYNALPWMTLPSVRDTVHQRFDMWWSQVKELVVGTITTRGDIANKLPKYDN